LIHFYKSYRQINIMICNSAVTTSGRSWSALIKNSACGEKVASSLDSAEVDTQQHQDSLGQGVRGDNECR